MSKLESSADTASEVAAYLMARLYVQASRLKDHETFHAVELWMAHLAGPAVAHCLELLINEGVQAWLTQKGYLGGRGRSPPGRPSGLMEAIVLANGCAVPRTSVAGIGPK